MNEKDKQTVTDDDKQTVTDDEADVFTPDEDEGARDTGQDDDLDSALDEIEMRQSGKTDSEPAKAKDTDDADLKARLDKLEKDREEERQKATQADVENALNQTVDSYLENDTIKQVYDRDEVRGLIEVEAGKDERVLMAFANRHSAPSDWNRVRAGLMKKIETKAASKVSQNRSEQEAATASAQGVSTSAPSQDDKVPSQQELAGMSDAELRKLKMEHDPNYGA